MTGLQLAGLIIGIIAGLIAIAGLVWALARRLLVPYVKRRFYDPLDPAKPVMRDAMEYKDVQLAITRLVDLLHPRRPDVVLGVDRGGAIIGGILAKQLGIPFRHLYLLGDGGGFAPGYDVSELKNKVVVLVDDCSRTGRTLDQAVACVRSHQGLKELITVVALFTPPARRGRESRTIPDYYAYHTDRANIKMPWDVVAYKYSVEYSVQYR